MTPSPPGAVTGMVGEVPLSLPPSWVRERLVALYPELAADVELPTSLILALRPRGQVYNAMAAAGVRPADVAGDLSVGAAIVGKFPSNGARATYELAGSKFRVVLAQGTRVVAGRRGVGPAEVVQWERLEQPGSGNLLVGCRIAFRDPDEAPACDLAALRNAAARATARMHAQREITRELQSPKRQRPPHTRRHAQVRREYGALRSVMRLLEEKCRVEQGVKAVGRVEDPGHLPGHHLVIAVERGLGTVDTDARLEVRSTLTKFVTRLAEAGGRTLVLDPPEAAVLRPGDVVSVQVVPRFEKRYHSRCLRAFLEEDVVGNWLDLADLLCDPASLRAAPWRGDPPPPPAPLFCEADGLRLNAEQRRAVAGALATPHAFFIQGPPGTGKTTVISEVVRQLAAEGQRVLLLSSTHVAVDEALGRIGRDGHVVAVRLTWDDAKVRESLRRYTPRELRKSWANSLRTQAGASRPNLPHPGNGEASDSQSAPQSTEESAAGQGGPNRRVTEVLGELRRWEDMRTSVLRWLDVLQGQLAAARADGAVVSLRAQIAENEKRLEDIGYHLESLRWPAGGAHTSDVMTLAMPSQSLAPGSDDLGARQRSLLTEFERLKAQLIAQPVRPATPAGPPLLSEKEYRGKLADLAERRTKLVRRRVPLEQEIAGHDATLAELESWIANDGLAKFKMVAPAVGGRTKAKKTRTAPTPAFETKQHDVKILRAAVGNVRRDRDHLRAQKAALEDEDRRLLQERAALESAHKGAAAARAARAGEEANERARLKQEAMLGARIAKLENQLARIGKLTTLRERWIALLSEDPGTAERLAEEVVASADLVCCTTNGVAGQDLIRNGSFDVLLVDEASRVTDAEFLIGAVRCRRWILVGDENQLPPFVDATEEHYLHGLAALHAAERGGGDLEAAVAELAITWAEDEEQRRFRNDAVLAAGTAMRASGAWGRHYRNEFARAFEFLREAGESAEGVLLQTMVNYLVRSMFERCVNRCPPQWRCRLVEQRRMIPVLAELVRTPVYGGEYRSAAAEDLRACGVAPLTTTTFPAPLVFLDTSAHGRSAAEALRGTGFVNELEQRWIVAACRIYDRELRARGDRRITVSVLAFYRAQAEQLRDRLIGRGGHQEGEGEFTHLDFKVVDAIDRIQGQESDLVFVSFCRAAVDRSVGPSYGLWLQDLRRLNVACTRAHRALVLVGHGRTLDRLCADPRAMAFYRNMMAMLADPKSGGCRLGEVRA